MSTEATPLPLALVIEDDEKLSEIYSAAVRQAGCQVRAVRRGDLALEELKNYCPHLVVLDLHLPYLSGPEILQAIRANPALEQTQVIIASSDFITAQTLEEQGDLVLIKPVSFTQLRDLAKRLLMDKIL